MHIIVHWRNEATDINDPSWLTKTQSIVDNSVLPNEMKTDLWQHFLAKSVSATFEQGGTWRDDTPVALLGHWQNQYAVKVLRECDLPIQDISTWMQLAQDIQSSPCSRLTEPRGMDLESDLWITQVLPTTHFILGQSHRLHDGDDTLNWHMALLKLRFDEPNNPIFVQNNSLQLNHSKETSISIPSTGKRNQTNGNHH